VDGRFLSMGGGMEPRADTLLLVLVKLAGGLTRFWALAELALGMVGLDPEGRGGRWEGGAEGMRGK
jgi:hypothetical protein